MTKKAEKMVSAYTEKFEIHVRYFETHTEMYKAEEKLDDKYNFTKDLLFDIKEDFVNMISGMLRFDMLSEKDFYELYDKAYSLYDKVLNNVIYMYIEEKY